MTEKDKKKKNGKKPTPKKKALAPVRVTEDQIKRAKKVQKKGVNNKKQIYKDVEYRQEIAPGHCTFSKIDNWSKQRCIKKGNIIYDLLN